MQLSAVDAQDIYLSAKAFTTLTYSELEAKWHQPAIERMTKIMLAMQQTSMPNAMSGQPQLSPQNMMPGGGNAKYR